MSASRVVFGLGCQMLTPRRRLVVTAPRLGWSCHKWDARCSCGWSLTGNNTKDAARIAWERHAQETAEA